MSAYWQSCARAGCQVAASVEQVCIRQVRQGAANFCAEACCTAPRAVSWPQVHRVGLACQAGACTSDAQAFDLPGILSSYCCSCNCRTVLDTSKEERPAW